MKSNWDRFWFILEGIAVIGFFIAFLNIPIEAVIQEKHLEHYFGLWGYSISPVEERIKFQPIIEDRLRKLYKPVCWYEQDSQRLKDALNNYETARDTAKYYGYIVPENPNCKWAER